MSEEEERYRKEEKYWREVAPKELPVGQIMTIRDVFAVTAMHSLSKLIGVHPTSSRNGGWPIQEEIDGLAENSYAVADAMLKQRKEV